MKHIFILVFSALLVFSNCKPKQTPAYNPNDNNNTSVQSSQSDTITYTYKNEFRQGETVAIKLQNTLGETLMLKSPRTKRVEYFKDNQWNNVRILYCPCGASCPPPPDEIPFPANAEFNFEWNQEMSWCEGTKFDIHKEAAPAGKYRALFGFSTSNKQSWNKWIYFDIK